MRQCECVKKLRELEISGPAHRDSRVSCASSPPPSLPVPAPPPAAVPSPCSQVHTQVLSPVDLCLCRLLVPPTPGHSCRPRILQTKEAGTVPPPCPGTQKRGHAAQESWRRPKAGPPGRVSVIGCAVLRGAGTNPPPEEPQASGRPPQAVPLCPPLCVVSVLGTLRGLWGTRLAPLPRGAAGRAGCALGVRPRASARQCPSEQRPGPGAQTS